jgi:uncharacterized protein YyaL (SSP411 family)
MSVSPGISWRDWSTDAFATAHRAAAPVLLVIGASWSAACRRFAADVLADAAVVDVVSRRFVAIAVDVDRRPDIALRYGLPEAIGDAAVAGSVAGPSSDEVAVDAMALPTLLCLTADGEVLSGGGAVDASRLARVLTKVADTVAAQRDDIERRAREARRARRESHSEPAPAVTTMQWPRGFSPGVGPGPVDVAEASAGAADALTHTFDDTWAGFGNGVKRPDVAAVAFALSCGVQTGHVALREMAVRTLDRLGWSDLSDAHTGAFHRLCRTRQWTEPDTARLLGVQAELAGLFLDAAVMLGEEAYADRARAAIDFSVAVLGDPAGGFFESEIVDDNGAHAIDAILVTASNARMVRTLLRAADVLRTPRYSEIALQAIERLVPVVYAQGAGVAHYLEARSDEPAEVLPRVRGLLVDQVETSAALLDLGDASGNRVYPELAEELMRGCLRKFWRGAGTTGAPCGGFLDRLRSSSGGGDIGRLGDPLVPFALNGLAARVLARLARDTGHDDLRTAALDTLAALAPSAFDHGLLAADYALAALDVTALVRA